MLSTVPSTCYATRPAESRGRLHNEEESPTRTCFQRDRDRVIHCAAFRRLEHKTQVFVYHEGDNYRSRLTHSIEVAQIARSVSRELGLNEDLAEAVALAHDLGHTPFGHAGEFALDAAMAPYGGFGHNAQTLRIVTHLERRYAAFDGLNLTWETLEGVVKHNGPVAADAVHETVRQYDARHDLELGTFPGPEAQVAALADDIAYNNHDLDDALRAGLFRIEDLADVPLVGDTFRDVSKWYPDIERSRQINEVTRRLITYMVNDLVTETRARAKRFGPQTVADVRALNEPLVNFSDEMRARDRTLKQFLHEHMYRHYRVSRMTSKARRVVADLFALFIDEPQCLPTDWRRRAGVARSAETARLVCDYIAGMTDRYAQEEHARLFDLTARV